MRRGTRDRFIVWGFSLGCIALMGMMFTVASELLEPIAPTLIRFIIVPALFVGAALLVAGHLVKVKGR